MGQDWGGLIGLRLVAEHPERFARIVAANTGLPTGDHPMPEIWHRFRQAVQTAPVLDVGRFVQSGCRRPMSDEVASRLRRAVPRRFLRGRAAGDARARPDRAGRSGQRGQPRGLGGAGRVAARRS